MTALSAAIFDLDGTLIDSVPDIAAALNKGLAGAGRETLSDAAVAKLVGGGARELVARAFGPATPAADIDRLFRDFLARYEAEPVARTRLYPGARDILADLRDRGLPLAICTNKPQPLTGLILDRLGLTGFFAAVWGAAPGRPLKPDAACLRSVCETLGTHPAVTVMVGDSHTDIDAACAAGCPSILVRHGYEQRPLETLGASLIVPDLAGAARAIAEWPPAAVSALREPA